MSKLSDDILNKYLDNELDSESRKKVENQLEFSEEDRKNYLALETVNSGLKNIKTYNVSSEFTSTLLSRLVKKSKAKKEQSIFILSISSVFVIISLIIVGIALTMAMGYKSGQSDTAPVLNNFVTILSSISDLISKTLTGRNVSILGSVISFALIISGYFFFETHKQMKEIK